MKKLLLFLLVFFATNLCAQTNVEWQDTYTEPDSPGYYEIIEGVKAMDSKNYNKAIKMFETASKKGSAWAMTKLCQIYYNGLGVQKDESKSYQYLYNAVELEYAPAMVYLAQLLLSEKQYDRAFSYLDRSINLGYELGLSYLARCYILGLGTTQDVAKGVNLLEKNIDSLGEDDYLYLANYYDDIKKYENAYKWLKKGADNNYFWSLIGVAKYNALGLGTTVDFKKAQEYLIYARETIEKEKDLSDDEKEERYITCFIYSGEYYMLEGDINKAKMVWNLLKEKYPQMVEKNKYNPNLGFISTMYAKEQEDKQLANNVDTTPKTIIVSDIDSNIPENSVTGKPIFAVIIANENYKDVKNVPMALHDGEIFKQYCEKTLGIPQNNIRYVADATLNNIRRELNWLNQVMDVYQGEATIIFYYAGHGIPNESNGAAYLLPIDGVGNDITTGYSLDKLYSDLNSKPAKSIIVILDACFSGSMRDGDMLTSARGVAIKAKQNAPTGNVVVLSATQGDETAYPYSEKGHGLFTYYLLKKIQEAKGDVTLGELSDYVTDQVKKQSIVINGKAQTPTVLTSPSLNDEWKNWKFK